MTYNKRKFGKCDMKKIDTSNKYHQVRFEFGLRFGGVIFVSYANTE